jgi:hypothetical protein
MTAPDITIYVRHSKGLRPCKYDGDESAKRCDCRKWLRWTADGKQHRVSAETRSWAVAERVHAAHGGQLTIRCTEALILAIRKHEELVTRSYRELSSGSWCE